MATTNKPEATGNKVRLSEGTREQLARDGFANSPFTGVLLVGTPDNFREATEAEYLAAVRETHAKRTAKKDSNLL